MKKINSFVEFPCSLEMKNLKILKIDFDIPKVEFNLGSLCNAISKMPVLSHLKIENCTNEFYNDYIFNIINQTLSEDKYVIVKPSKVVRFHGFSFLFGCEQSKFISQIEIYKDCITSKSPDSFLEISVPRHFFGKFIIIYRNNSSLLSNCNVFKRERGTSTLLLPVTLSYDSSSDTESDLSSSNESSSSSEISISSDSDDSSD